MAPRSVTIGAKAVAVARPTAFRELHFSCVPGSFRARVPVKAILLFARSMPAMSGTSQGATGSPPRLGSRDEELRDSQEAPGTRANGSLSAFLEGGSIMAVARGDDGSGNTTR